MKAFKFAFILSIFFFIACGSDDESVTINYDGDNFSAPLLEAGEYTAAARFPSSSLTSNIGKQLTAIDFFILQLPQQCSVQIFEEGSTTAPGNMIYNQNVTLDIDANNWNTHTLSTPITLEDKDYWLAISVVHDGDDMTIGCDEGPALTNGDYFNDAADQWTTLRDFSAQEVDINWNIRGIITE